MRVIATILCIGFTLVTAGLLFAADVAPFWRGYAVASAYWLSMSVARALLDKRNYQE